MFLHPLWILALLAISSAEIVTLLVLPTKPLDRPIVLLAIDVSQIGSNPLQLILQVGALHKETISFLVLSSAICPVVQGLPWLRLHSPTVDWHTSWGPDCRKTCLHQASPPVQP